MSSHHFVPGDNCYLDAILCNAEGQHISDIPLFCLLDVYGIYFFYPSWSELTDWQLIDNLRPGEITWEIIPRFVWPDTGSSANGLKFLAAMVQPDFSDLFGEMDVWEFGYE